MTEEGMKKINKTLTKFIPYNKYRIKKYFMTSFLFFIINILSAYSSMSEEYDNKSKTQIFDITESNMTLEEEFAYLAYDITDTWVYNGSYKIPSLPTADNYIINIHQNTFIDSTSSRLIDITADTQTYGDRNFPFVTIQGSEDATLSASISYTPYACITDNIYVVGAQNGWLNLDVPLQLQMNSPGESRATDSSWNAVEAYASGGVYLKGS